MGTRKYCRTPTRFKKNKNNIRLTFLPLGSRDKEKKGGGGYFFMALILLGRENNLINPILTINQK